MSTTWNFRRTMNSICFNDDYGEKASCVISIDVQVLKDGCFKVNYVNQYNGETEELQKTAKTCHPLYYKSIKEEDEDMLGGVIVTGNPITFHMIQCLMCDDTDKTMYDTGCRPYNHYCGEVMRALTELEF